MLNSSDVRVAKDEKSRSSFERFGREESSPIAEEAAEWLRRLDCGEPELDNAFASWVTQSPEHLEEFLLATAIDRQLRMMGERRLQEATIRLRPQKSTTEEVLYEDAASGNGDSLEKLYLRYRRPLIQVFLQRRIARDVAQDLLQRTFMQAITKIRAEGLEDSSELGRFLYKTACGLASAYWRGELARRRDMDTEVLENLRDEALTLEERVDHELLAKCVRTLMMHLPMERDREVLSRFYVNEESRDSICQAMGLSSLQFNQLLWRARLRLGEILKGHGVSLER